GYRHCRAKVQQALIRQQNIQIYGSATCCANGHRRCPVLRNACDIDSPDKSASYKRVLICGYFLAEVITQQNCGFFGTAVWVSYPQAGPLRAAAGRWPAMDSAAAVGLRLLLPSGGNISPMQVEGSHSHEP